MKGLTSAGLAAIGRDSFAFGLECSWIMMLEETRDTHVFVDYPTRYQQYEWYHQGQ